MTNQTDKNIYIPNILEQFKIQANDSLLILDKAFKRLSVLRGYRPDEMGADGISGLTGYKSDESYASFLKKKDFGRQVISMAELTEIGKDLKPLFLKKGESFILYNISPIHFLYNRDEPFWHYEIVFYLNEKSNKDAPDQIGGYKKYSIESFQTKPISITGRNNKRTKKIVVKDSNGHVLSKFNLPTHKYKTQQ
ncbi:hypothetical protein [Pedobacter sp. UYP30]|uniref:hypothetical protein n=1 Tax=Pedobacter sp. UYP30 TaxID=1756400 RepID=UPI003398EBEB